MNRKYKWLNEFLAYLITQKIIEPDIGDVRTLDHFNARHSYPKLLINPAHWQRVFSEAQTRGYRFSALWAEDFGNSFKITASLEFLGEPFFVQSVIPASYQIASIASYYPGANRLERHAHDMLGITFIGSDQRRWTKHKAWPEDHFPLRKNSNAAPDAMTPPDTDYPFLNAEGIGVFEIPVGPVHAGIIEPGHFRFQVAGEGVINLEERLGYVHKGIEKIAEGKNIWELTKLSGRISGDSTAAYACATCFAAENALGLEVPNRASFLRALLIERERIANHLGDFAAIANDTGFGFAYYQLMRLKELWLRVNKEIFDHRLMMDVIIPGGVAKDLNEEDKSKILDQLNNFKKELSELYPIIEENSSLHDRLKNTGILTKETAVKLGALGYVARASGCSFDLRRDLPYAPYDQLKVRIPVYNTGDVLSRTRIRAQEILASLEIIENLLTKLPDGAINLPWPEKHETVEGIGLVEGWRGEILIFLRLNDDGLVDRYFPRDPSWFNWLALEHLIHNNIVPDFPVCNKSINGTYSGVDL